MTELIETLFSSGSFIPHGHCYLWQPGLVWLNLISDSLIALAYYSIPLTLFYFIRKRKDVPFDWIFGLFGAFIILCGTTHLMEVWTLWHPTYWLSGSLKASTALVSLYTAVVLVQLMPQALTIPSTAQLAEVNEELQRQIQIRQQAEAQINQLNQALEIKVAERTAALEQSMIQVKNNAERATLAMDAAHLGAWDWDLRTQIILWNPYHEILFGYQPGTPVRSYEDWSQRVHPEDLPKVEALIQNTLSSKQDFFAEYRIIWDDQSVHWISAIGRLYYNEADEPLRMAGMVQDITERKQVSEALQLSEERLRLATEAADIGMWFWNLEKDELVWTARCKTLFGLAPDMDVTYARFLDALHPDDRDPTNAAVQQAIQHKEEYAIEYRTVWSDNSVHWLSAKGCAFYNENSQPIRMMGIAQDITGQKQTEFDLQERAKELSQTNQILLQTTALLDQRNQELDQFAYIVSHDLKSPLRAISNLSGWIEEDLADQATEETQQHLALMRSRVCRMEMMINGLLAYARVGYQDAPCETFSLQDLLQEVIDSLDIPAEFTVRIPSDLPTLNSQQLLLSQVFANLISNAVKHHNRPDGCVNILVQPHTEGLGIQVSDDGPGISPQDCDRVFNLFETATANDSKDSTGIGLALVKKIIERQGGKIELESELGQGTTFRFIWPTGC